MRETKRDSHEVKYTRVQVERANQVWGNSKKPITPGMTEQEIFYNAGISAVLAWLQENEGSVSPMRAQDVLRT